MRRRPDIELIALVRDGSSEAAGALFDRYWEFAWRAAYAVTADEALADDAAQDAIQRAFAALGDFDETRPFGPWLKRIAVNKAVDQLRRRGKLSPYDGEDATRAWPSIPGADDDDLRLAVVAGAVAALSSPKRAVVVLRYWVDLPLDEIAGVLGLPVGTVASRLSRALEELRLVLEHERVL